jgi:hypothetical protein
LFRLHDIVDTKRTLLMKADPKPRTGWIIHLLVFGLDVFSCTGARIGALFPEDKDKNRRKKGLRYKVSAYIETFASAD